MGTTRGAVWAVLILLVSSAAGAAERDPAALRSAARAERDRGAFPAAIASLQALLESGAATVEDELLLAETLAWDKRFDAAEARYRAVLERAPSDGARIGLGRVLLWSGRYREARAVLRDAAGADALEVRATAAYWAGDTRTAAREFRALLASGADRETARKSVAEIEDALRPAQSAGIRASRDDQPFESIATEITASDSLTALDRWTVSATQWRLFSEDDDRTSHATRLAAGLEHIFPWQRLTLAATAGAIRLPGNDTEFVGGLTATLGVRRSRIQLGFDRRELLTNPADAYGVVDARWIQWAYDDGKGRLAAARAERLSYFDRNHGLGAYAYGIAPAIRGETFSVWGGLSAAYRDSDDPRFYPVRVSGTLDGGAFRYTYRGRYIPYYTPRDQREVRAIAGARREWRRVTLHVQVDGGVARDKASAFGPRRGPTPLPPFIGTFEFERQFQPYRGTATVTIPITSSFIIESAFEHNRTADYHANTVHAVVRRR